MFLSNSGKMWRRTPESFLVYTNFHRSSSSEGSLLGLKSWTQNMAQPTDQTASIAAPFSGPQNKNPKIFTSLERCPKSCSGRLFILKMAAIVGDVHTIESNLHYESRAENTPTETHGFSSSSPGNLSSTGGIIPSLVHMKQCPNIMFKR